MAVRYSASDEEVRKLYRFDRLLEESAYIAPDTALGDAHVQAFWDKGFLVMDRLLDEQEVADAIAELQDIIHGKIPGPKVEVIRKKDNETPEERELNVRKIASFVDYCPALRHISDHPKILNILKSLYRGEDARFIVDQALLKPPSPEAGVEKPWHQDMAYGNFAYDKMVIGIWIALDEATLENGCMHVIPGSHRLGPIPHYAVRDWQICDINVQVEHDVAVPMKPGSVLFFTGMTHHGTPPNYTDRRRRALQIHYVPASAEKLSPKQYKALFTNQWTQAEC